MKTSQDRRRRRSARRDLSGRPLRIRVVEESERERFDGFLEEYHYLGEGRPAGDTMRMVAEVEGEWVGLLMWGSACYRLKPRDEWIGWNPAQRARRQKLVVQNRRFLLLGERGAHPNLASRVLGAAVRELPGLWRSSFGYEPLLAETFTDIECFEGTCYKASGWEPLGMSKGYSRHSADFYVPNERPKKLWVKALRRDAAAMLGAMRLPPECEAGAQSNADGVLPLGVRQVESLYAALGKVPDPRGHNRSFALASVLAIVAMGIFSGYHTLAAIHRLGKRLDQNQRRTLRLPRFKAGSSYRKEPSYKVYYNLLSKLDIEAFATVLSAWLSQHSGTLPASLALDGKFIRDTVGLVCMVDHETGVPCAMAPASQKEGEGDKCELKVGRQLIEGREDWSHALITADALHCQTRTAREIVLRGGDYFVQVKDNQKGVHRTAAALTEELSPLLPRTGRPTAASTPMTSPCARPSPRR